MFKPQKLWLCGMIRGQRKVLEQSISHVLKYFNGCIFVVDSKATKEDVEWLEYIKGEGKIIVKKWINDHAHTSNEVLLSGLMNWSDYLVWIDETDICNEVFIKELRENIKYWHKNNVGQVRLDHPFVLRYHSGLRVAGNPHWNFINIIGSTVNLEQIGGFRKENYVKNNRDTLQSGFIRPATYWFCYPPFSNHSQLLYYQFSPELHHRHEQIRINFQFYCQEVLGLELTLDSLIKYMQENVGKYDGYFEEVLETEVSLKDVFRLFVLNQKWQVLASNRFNFSYFRWKKDGVIEQGKNDGYVGLFNVYKLQKGEKME